MDHILPMVPSFDGLRAVLAAAHGGSFSAAAEMLGLTHGAVSRRVAGVESWLGAGIFERHGRGVRLTPAGQRFTRQVEQALEAIEQTSERWRPRQGRSTVRLSVVPSFAKLWLVPRLEAMLERLPAVRVELLVEHRAVDLGANEADVVVRYGRGDWPGLQVRHLFAETLLPVASPALARRLGEDPSAEALSGCPLIHDSDTSQWRSWFAGAAVKYRPKAEDRRFEDYDLVLAAAEASLGLALVRLPLAQSWLDDGKLVAVSPRSHPNPSAHHIAHRRDEQRDGVLRFVDELCRTAHGSVRDGTEFSG